MSVHKWTPNFHTYTRIDNKSCKVIVDKIVDINVVSPTAIDKFGLRVVDHPQPYRIYWIDNATYEVTHRCPVLIDFKMYKANIWCDVIPINVGHIFLGYSWLYGTNAFLDQRFNTYRFNHNGIDIKLLPSKPKTKPIELKPNAPNESHEVSICNEKENPE